MGGEKLSVCQKKVGNIGGGKRSVRCGVCMRMPGQRGATEK